jgi:hypothetical protein
MICIILYFKISCEFWDEIRMFYYAVMQLILARFILQGCEHSPFTDLSLTLQLLNAKLRLLMCENVQEIAGDLLLN